MIASICSTLFAVSHYFHVIRYAAIINFFSSKSKHKKSALTESAKLNLNKSDLKDCANTVYNNISKQYQKTFGVNFAYILIEKQKR